MRLPFLDRDREVARLRRALSSPEASFCCVYGRRRCGKSRLLQEVVRRDTATYYAADEREAPLQRAALAAAMADHLSGMGQVVYPDWASLFQRWWRDARPGSVLAIDEFPYLVRTSPEIPSLLQKLLDGGSAGSPHLVLCGSSQRMMQGLVLDATAPLYGRAREILDVRPLGMYWLGQALGLTTVLDALESYAVWGGVPRYWELAADHADLWDGVQDAVLDPMGVLHDEPHRLLMDDLRDTAQASSILSLVGAGCARLSEIAARLAKPATSLTRPIQRLTDLGFLRRQVPFGSEERSGKRTAYSVADPFLAFWYRFVEPNRSRLEAGLVEDVAADVRRDFPGHAAAIWEQVRQAFPHLHVGGLNWLPAGRWWGAGTDRQPLEVDVVSESTDRGTLFVGEVKLRLDALESDRVAHELDAKVRRLPFAATYQQVITGVVAAAPKRESQLPAAISPQEVLLATR